jgi:hypothetical protein
VEGPATYGGKTQYTLSIWLDGWYPICEEIRAAQIGIQLTGKGPAYNGSGLKWIGDGTRTESMIHLSQSDFSKIDGVGFIAPPQKDPAKRLLSAIRTSCQTNYSPQRRLRFEDFQVSDNLGYFGIQSDVYDYAFVAGVLSGWDGSKNSNDDFFVLDNFNIGFCESAIRVTNNQAVQWSITNFGSYGCDYMYYSDHGGSFLGRNWYPNSQLRKSVIHCAGYPWDSLHVDLTGFSCEHMQCESLVSATSSLSGHVQGLYAQASSTDKPRDFYWLKLDNHASCQFSFRDLVGGTTNYYGTEPVRHVVKLGPHVTSKVDYKLSFDDCRGVEELVQLAQPKAPKSWRTIDLTVNGRRVDVDDTKDEYTPIGKLLK